MDMHAARDGGRGQAMTAVVVGASLAGLMTGLALADAGLQVTLLERSGDSGRTGAAIRTGANPVAQLLRGKPGFAMPRLEPGLHTWHAVHAGLLAAAAGMPNIRLLPDTPIVDIQQDEGAAWAVSADGRAFVADLVVGADGHRSVVRRAVDPSKPDATFAGYMLWLGLAQERDVASARPWPVETAFLDDGDATLLGYPLPGAGGSTRRGTRQLGWAWYDCSRNTLLRDLGCVRGVVVQHSLGGDSLPRSLPSELLAEARGRWPDPWLEAIADCASRHAIVGTPVAEYMPDAIVNGRLALVGDAAHVPTPMTGGGFGESLADAKVLASVLVGSDGKPGVQAALRAYEAARLPKVRKMVEAGVGFSQAFAAGR